MAEGAFDEVCVADRPVALMRRAWLERDRRSFLEVLATTGDVGQAARVIGRTAQAAHTLRRKDQAIALAWASAIDTACEAIHAAAIAETLRTAQNGESNASCPACGQTPRPFDAALAFRILNYRLTRDARPREAPQRNFRAVPIAEVEAALTKRIAAIVRKRKPA